MSEAEEMDVRILNYTDLTDQEAFDVWLSECPVEYNWQMDDMEGEGSMYYIYAFKVEIDNG